MTTDTHAPKPDLATQIREAEQRVIAADRDWQRHTEALGVAVRGHAGRAATFGGLGVATALVGGLLLRWRQSSRSKAREQLLTRALSAVRWPGAAARQAVAPAPTTVRSAAKLTSVIATVGTLLGAAARVGLKLPAKSGVASMVFRLAMPMLSRWLRSRTAVPATPVRPVPPPVPVPPPMPVARPPVTTREPRQF